MRGGVFGRAIRVHRQQQRRAGIVNQHVVDLIDDRRGERSLQSAARFGRGTAQQSQELGPQRSIGKLSQRHLIAKVIEAEFGPGRERDIARICRSLLFGGCVGLDKPDGRTEHFVQRLEHLAIAFGQIRIRRRDMHTATDERIQERGKYRGECLPFSGLHLSD